MPFVAPTNTKVSTTPSSNRFVASLMALLRQRSWLVARASEPGDAAPYGDKRMSARFEKMQAAWCSGILWTTSQWPRLVTQGPAPTSAADKKTEIGR